ncbi:MAG: hypothetical protein GQ582_07700 [Methyloprofundus sp.]|nr:hypothetical protein [Methyloprofundus sp.]
MARCQSCSAPLLANTNRCQYCNVRNDVDLHAKRNFTVTNTQQLSDRICPHCDKQLQTVELELADTIFIERCDQCFGLFFDLGEIEALLDHAVSNVGGINGAHIDNINRDRYDTTRGIRYIKCPVCQAFMRRMNFAKKSGVIVDSCRHHGFWLDSGEITHLMEWKKAGGQLLHEQQPVKERIKQKREKISQSSEGLWGSLLRDKKKDTDVLDVLSYITKKLF